jgi:TonB family protein
MGLILLAVFTPTAQAAPRKVIEKPDWIAKPSGEDLERFFPKRAKEERVSGKATIKCVVTAEGVPERCTVLKETPKGYGFGEAALAMASTFRMSPKRVDGQVIEGAEVTIPLVFNMLATADKSDLGYSAVILTRVESAGPAVPAAMTTRCPDGQGDCQAHFVEWVAKPDAKQIARILGPVPVEPDGSTFAACAIAAGGLLEDCELWGDVTPVTEAAALALIGTLKAGPKTADGLPTASETVMIPFFWDWLKLGSKEMAKRNPKGESAVKAETP